MNLHERRRRLDGGLLARHALWHPQPFRAARPAWCAAEPALASTLLALSDGEVEQLHGDSRQALAWLARQLPDQADELAELLALSSLSPLPRQALPAQSAWAKRDIPGRKLAQIEAFAGAARSAGLPVLDWCGGKGHLGRWLAGQWQQPVTTLEIDAVLCAEGEDLARRNRLAHAFACADALAADGRLLAGRQAVALHACGELHRSLVARAAASAVGRLDVAPCCYHRGVATHYRPLADGTALTLTRDDTRLAVTETVTAAPRQARQRDREMAWKLGFAEWRRDVAGIAAERTFKPVPAAWMRGTFGEFLGRMAEREGLPVCLTGSVGEFERRGWQRQREVMRLSVPRQAFRRALELWLVLDLAACLDGQGYQVEIGEFCDARLTPRNLMLSARRCA